MYQTSEVTNVSAHRKGSKRMTIKEDFHQKWEKCPQKLRSIAEIAPGETSGTQFGKINSKPIGVELSNVFGRGTVSLRRLSKGIFNLAKAKTAMANPNASKGKEDSNLKPETFTEFSQRHIQSNRESAVSQSDSKRGKHTQQTQKISHDWQDTTIYQQTFTQKVKEIEDKQKEEL